VPIAKADEWAERIAAQQRSGISVSSSAKKQGLTEYSFYAWANAQKKERYVSLWWIEVAGRSRRRRPRWNCGVGDRERLRIGAGGRRHTFAPVVEALRR